MNKRNLVLEGKKKIIIEIAESSYKQEGIENMKTDLILINSLKANEIDKDGKFTAVFQVDEV